MPQGGSNQLEGCVTTRDTLALCHLSYSIQSLRVPIIVSDNIELPFDGMVDYSEFSSFVAVSHAFGTNWLLGQFKKASLNNRRINLNFKRRFAEHSCAWVNVDWLAHRRWQSPQSGWLKLNLDVAIRYFGSYIAVSVRDSHCSLCMANTERLCATDPQVSEASWKQRCLLRGITSLGLFLKAIHWCCVKIFYLKTSLNNG